MKRFTLSAVLALSATVYAEASQADTYTIDPNHTYPTIEYSHLGYSVQRLRFDRTAGQITLDSSKLDSGSIDITIDADSLNSGNAEFNEHLRGEEFFDVKKFPNITFKSRRMRVAGKKVISVSGDLTIKGITKPVMLSVVSFYCMLHPMKQKDACGANAEARVKRSDFGLGKHAPAVSDDVTVRIAVEALKN